MSENQQNFNTALVKVTNTFAPMIERQLTGNGVKMDGYSKQCVVNAISSINTVLDASGIEWNNAQLDRNNVTQILLNVAALKLNAAASPREVYFQLRSVKINGQWMKQIEMGIEGDGNDAILSRFGRDIEKVGQFWMVREGDHFEYPSYNGFDLEPPKWSPTGKGEVIRIVYPIRKTDGTAEYYIAEREDVIRNLLAHINNNLMNQTFDICKDRYNATAEQKKQINAKKKEIIDKVRELGLNSLDDPELQQWISPAWTDHHSREQMLIRKMRNNIVKKIPKDFGNAFVELTYSETSDDAAERVRREINENANREIIEIEPLKPQEEQEPVTEPEEVIESPVETEDSESEGQQKLDIEENNKGPGF